MRNITFLGTGHGMPKSSATTSLFIKDENTNLLVDVSGGYELIRQFNKIGINPEVVENIFLSHSDSYHILGISPLIRVFRKSKKTRTLFCSPEVKEAIDSILQYTANKHYQEVLPFLNIVLINDNLSYEFHGWNFTFFDKKSNKTPQFGFTVTFPDNTKLSFLGDEPLNEHEITFVKDSDIFIHEAFCLENDMEFHRPHPKKHSTVKEAALYAAKVNAKKLVLFHMEDDSLETRKKEYYNEASNNFKREIFVPVDLDVMVF